MIISPGLHKHPELKAPILVQFLLTHYRTESVPDFLPLQTERKPKHVATGRPKHLEEDREHRHTPRGRGIRETLPIS